MTKTYIFQVVSPWAFYSLLFSIVEREAKVTNALDMVLKWNIFVAISEYGSDIRQGEKRDVSIRSLWSGYISYIPQRLPLHLI